MPALTYRHEWTTGAPTHGRTPQVGDAVRVEAWGKTTGARMVDVGRTGTIVAVRRTRVLVALDAGNGEPATEAAIWPACLAYRAAATKAAAASTQDDGPAWSAALASPDRGAAADRAEAERPALTLTAFGAALLDTATCEHGIPMDEPCRACAVAGHEPVDVDEDDTPELTDAARHLADCRSCALHLPDGHDYASLIDVPLTAEELATLAAREDVDNAVRQVAADCLAELAEDEHADDECPAPTCTERHTAPAPDPARAYTMRSTRFRQAAARNRVKTAIRRCPDHARGIHAAPCPGPDLEV